MHAECDQKPLHLNLPIMHLCGITPTNNYLSSIAINVYILQFMMGANNGLSVNNLKEDNQ